MSSVVSEAEMAGHLKKHGKVAPGIHSVSSVAPVSFSGWTEARTAGSPYPRGPELSEYLGFCLLWLSDGVCPTWLSVIIVTTVTE